MKKYISCLALALSASFVFGDADPNPFSDYKKGMEPTVGFPMAVEYQATNAAAIEAVTTLENMDAILHDEKKMKELLATVGDQTYGSDPLQLTLIAAVTQRAMCRKVTDMSECRHRWVAQLIKEARDSDSVYRQLFMLDQLRWCAFPENVRTILEIGDKSSDQGVRDMAILVANEVAPGEIEPWRTPKVNSVNRLPARSIVVPCESAETALAIAKGERARTDSKFLQSLDGTWDFKYKADVYDTLWIEEGKIAVPGCWQLAFLSEDGEKDLPKIDPPVYTNHRYPIVWDGSGNPMLTPPENFTSFKYRNPVGSYSRTFEIDPSWKGRRVVLHFGGVSSAMWVTVNGKEAGYSEDSRLPAEFDITQFLHEGDNLLEVEVYKHCDGSFIEDQDFWRLSGIFRSVWLVAENAEAPKDFVLETELSDDYSKGTVRVLDENGKPLMEKTFDNPKLWSNESPNLYEVGLELCGDHYAFQFGFRRIEIKNSVVYLNGKRMVICGVNRHEMSPKTGYTVSLEDMKRDIAIMKDLNVNAVRTCHYPDDPTWYELCDRAGLYVVCEANVEAHGVPNFYAAEAPSIPKNRRYHDAIVERGVNMVKVFRNHPSVIFWSLGNESGDGPAMKDEYTAMRQLDATRPIQYEGAQDSDHSDIKCPMYARPWAAEQYVRDNPAKPFILCEFAHAMGNSTGAFGRYMELIEKYPSFQGGFIWDFADQALMKGNVLAYGGDFGDAPNDDNFNCNGIIAADRTYHPGAYEVKHYYGGGKSVAEPEFKAVEVPAGGKVQNNSSFRLNFFRAPTDNDRGWEMEQKCAVWKLATEKQLAPEGAESSLVVRDLGKGKSVVELSLNVTDGKLPPVPRVGVTFKIPETFRKVAWQGLGPWENYPDRKASARFDTFTANIGVASGLADANGVFSYIPNALNPDNYIEPCEQGYRTGCRWVEFTSADGKKIRITALDKPFGFNAWPYSQESLERARHQYELKDEGEITVNVDAAMMGVGGDNSWGNRPHDEFMLGKGEYTLKFLVERN